jgi:hypothetical protein
MAYVTESELTTVYANGSSSRLVMRILVKNVFLDYSNNNNKTGNVHINVTLGRVGLSIATVEKPQVILILSACL